MTPRPRSYGVGLAIAVDQLLNALFGGNPDETMSSSLWGAQLSGRHPIRTRAAVATVNALAYALTWAASCGRTPQRDHCRKSYEGTAYPVTEQA